jgi:hypothetical protein
MSAQASSTLRSQGNFGIFGSPCGLKGGCRQGLGGTDGLEGTVKAFGLPAFAGDLCGAGRGIAFRAGGAGLSGLKLPAVQPEGIPAEAGRTRAPEKEEDGHSQNCQGDEPGHAGRQGRQPAQQPAHG